MKEIQAYIILRGSQLSGDDKKRVLVESGAEADGALTQTRVNQATRMLGSSFFQDYVGFRKLKTKTYDSQTMMAEGVSDGDGENEVFLAENDPCDDPSIMDQLANDGDPDAILVSEYEQAMTEAVQEDNDLASCYNAYVEARHRLTERFKSRGFWPIKGKGKSFKGSGKGKKGAKKSLEQRILSSSCRLCGQRATGRPNALRDLVHHRRDREAAQEFQQRRLRSWTSPTTPVFHWSSCSCQVSKSLPLMSLFCTRRRLYFLGIVVT